MAINIFFSWQSDLDSSTHKNLICNAIDKATKDLKKESIIINADRDTKGLSGSPNIETTIFKKISNCDLFVADVTIVNKHWLNKKRKMPNPNVMYELGFAIKSLGSERVICIINNDVCSEKDLPFDIKQHRLTSYSLKNGKDNAKKKLADDIKSSIKILQSKGMLPSPHNERQNYLVETSCNDILFSNFTDTSASFYITHNDIIDFTIKKSTHGEWDIIGSSDKRGYNFKKDFKFGIDYNTNYFQITCIDLDDDDKKEILVTIGDRKIEQQTNIYVYVPESTNIFEYCGSIQGQEKLVILEERKKVILNPYGSQGLSDEYIFYNRSLWSKQGYIKL